MRQAFLLLIFVLNSGCSSVFLQPDKRDHFPDIANHVLYQAGFIPTPDGESLHYWLIPAQKNKMPDSSPKGMVIQVHGNAQNLTSHVRSLAWIVASGYDLVIFDYRGYGKSSGKKDLDGAYADVVTAIDYITSQINLNHLPIILYGQSLGGTLLLKAVSEKQRDWHPKAVVVESSFYSYPGIAREKLADIWFTWPVQWLPYLLVTSKYSLDKKELQSISPVPVWLFASENDPIVPMHHTKRIFDDLNEPKKFITFPERSHVAAMFVQTGRYRKELLNFLDSF